MVEGGPDRTDGSRAAFLDDPALRQSRLLQWYGRAALARIPPRRVAALARMLEGGEAFSRTLRRILWEKNGVRVEAYSRGGFMQVTTARLDGLSVGRYATGGRTMRWGLPHPLDRISTSPVFYPDNWGRIESAPRHRLQVGHDAWIGERVAILTGCRSIGIGAVVRHGAVVTTSVPDFAIVEGCPARLVGYRFEPDVQDRILSSRWWELDIEALRPWRRMLADRPDPGALCDALDAIIAHPRPASGPTGAGDLAST